MAGKTLKEIPLQQKESIIKLQKQSKKLKDLDEKENIPKLNKKIKSISK